MTEFGITFTNARCTIFDIARVLSTVFYQQLTSFKFSKALIVFHFLKVYLESSLGFRNFYRMSNRLVEF